MWGCALIVLLEALLTGTVAFVLCMVICLLSGVLIYAKACYLDMNSLFAQIDYMAKRKNCRIETELKQAECVKDAVILNGRVNR